MMSWRFWNFIAKAIHATVRGAVLYGKIPVTIGLKKVVSLLSKYQESFIYFGQNSEITAENVLKNMT